MKNSSTFQKLMSSVINILITLIIFVPFYFLFEETITRKFILIGIFFIYNLFFLIFNNSRCLGMIIMHTYYDKIYPKKNQLIYLVLYTLSFSSLLFSFFFPFDLFILNMVLLQLPSIILKKTTFHGYLSGNIRTVSKD